MGNNNGGEIGAFFAGFLVGGLVGAATALILAPQSGEETREQIRQRAVEIQGRAEDTLGDARAKAEAVAADGPRSSRSRARPCWRRDRGNCKRQPMPQRRRLRAQSARQGKQPRLPKRHSFRSPLAGL